jgi:hypothetical protein
MLFFSFVYLLNKHNTGVSIVVAVRCFGRLSV